MRRGGGAGRGGGRGGRGGGLITNERLDPPPVSIMGGEEKPVTMVITLSNCVECFLLL